MAIEITASEGKTFAYKTDPTRPIGTMLTLAKSLTREDFIEIDKPIETEPVVEVDNEENDFIEIDKPVVENDEEEITTLRRQGWNKE